MTLQSGTRPEGSSRDREASSAAARPALGTPRAELGMAATLALGRALDLVPRREQYRPSGGALDRLRAVRELRGVLEQLERVDVVDALHAGASFEDVGRALGMSRSAADRKHGGPLR